MLRVSVIIPMYNGEQYIADAIKSLLNQQKQKVFEIIVVDDGSTDDSRQIVKKLQSEHSQIKLLHQKNQGQSSARNLGVSKANGEYIAFLDCDDIWLPNKLDRQISQIRNSQDVVLFFTDAKIISKHKNTTQFSIIKPKRGRIFSQLIFGCFINCDTVIMKKELFLRSGGFRTSQTFRYIEDFDLWLRISKMGNIDYLDEPLVVYRRHAGSSSHNKIKTSINVIRMILRENVDQDNGFDYITKTMAIFRHIAVLIMYLLHLNNLILPL